MAHHPLPDLSDAFTIGDPAERLRAVLRPFYGWYRKTAQANANMQRDRLVMPALDAVMRIRMDQEVATLADALDAGLTSRFNAGQSGQQVHAAVALALDFWTWRRLSQEGLADEVAADMMVASVKAVASS